ncbi:hypothetical protein [Prosthecobacter sp.]|uniref:hypothetical protein n=1 Tax=Prosthecobacter sp. TaxID=1965333 RepID=UPI0037840637
MKLPFSLCLAFAFSFTSCERHAELKRELASLQASSKQDEAAIQKLDQDIASFGGTGATSRYSEQAQLKQEQLRPLEFAIPPRERQLSAIETEFARLKPAAEAYKAAHLK